MTECCLQFLEAQICLKYLKSPAAINLIECNQTIIINCTGLWGFGASVI